MKESETGWLCCAKYVLDQLEDPVHDIRLVTSLSLAFGGSFTRQELRVAEILDVMGGPYRLEVLDVRTTPYFFAMLAERSQPRLEDLMYESPLFDTPLRFLSTQRHLLEFTPRPPPGSVNRKFCIPSRPYRQRQVARVQEKRFERSRRFIDSDYYLTRSGQVTEKAIHRFLLTFNDVSRLLFRPFIPRLAMAALILHASGRGLQLRRAYTRWCLLYIVTHTCFILPLHPGKLNRQNSNSLRNALRMCYRIGLAQNHQVSVWTYRTRNLNFRPDIENLVPHSPLQDLGGIPNVQVAHELS